MIPRVVARPAGLRGLRPGDLQPRVTSHFYSSASIKTVPLSYDLHEPAKPMSDNPNRASPILFLHGLFGSKKNNRSISKYVDLRADKKSSGRARERLNMSVYAAEPLLEISGGRYMH